MNPKRKLKKVDVSFISLVGKGANNKTIIWKSKDNTGDYSRIIPIAKVNNDERMVYGIVYSPDEVDSQGDTATAETIKEMAYSFMKSQKTTQIDKQHDFEAGQGFVAESWLTKASDPLFPSSPEGSWAVGIKVENDETWELVKSGEITGLSLAGTAVVEEVADQSFLSKLKKMLFEGEVAKSGKVFSKNNLTKLKSIQTTLSELISQVEAEGENSTNSSELKKGETTMTEQELNAAIAKALEPVTKQITDLQKSLSDKVEALEKTANERIEKIEKATPGSQQADDSKTGDANKPQNIWI